MADCTPNCTTLSKSSLLHSSRLRRRESDKDVSESPKEEEEEEEEDGVDEDEEEEGDGLWGFKEGAEARTRERTVSV